jgi:predicted MPP superfamily phosphohydrolase
MYRTYVLLLFLFLSSSAFPNSLFTISPYLIIEDHGHVTLNFQTAEDTELEVLVEQGSHVLETSVHSASGTANKLQKISLGKLNCGRKLRYRISSKNQLIDNSLYSIPCDRDKPLWVGFLSDTQIKNSQGQDRALMISSTITSLQNRLPFSLIINAGDIVQRGGLETEWINFFNTASNYLKTSYLLAAVGNHEYFDSPSFDKMPPEFMNYMRNGSGDELGYAQVELPSVNFLVINSNFESMSEVKILQQWNWLEGKLKVARMLGKPSIVVMHHSPYSSSLEHLREIPSRLRRELVPLLEKYKVKLMLSGHLHMYERSQKEGVTYLIAGPSGGINNVISYRNPFSLFVKQFTTTFSVLKIMKDKIEVVTYEGSQSSVIDKFAIPLI